MAGFAAGTLARGLRRGDELTEARRRKAWENMAAAAAELRLQQDRADAVEAAFLRPLKRTQAETAVAAGQEDLVRARSAEQRAADAATLNAGVIQGTASRAQQDQEAQRRTEADRVFDFGRSEIAQRPDDFARILPQIRTRYEATGQAWSPELEQSLQTHAQSAGAAYLDKGYRDSLAAVAANPEHAPIYISELQKAAAKLSTSVPDEWIATIHETARRATPQGRANAAVDQAAANEQAMRDWSRNVVDQARARLNTPGISKTDAARYLQIIERHGETVEPTGLEVAGEPMPVGMQGPPAPRPQVRTVPAAAGIGTAERLFASPAAAAAPLSLAGTTRTAAARGRLSVSQNIEAMAQEMMAAVTDKTMTPAEVIKRLNDAVTAGALSRAEAALVRGKYNQLTTAARRTAHTPGRGGARPTANAATEPLLTETQRGAAAANAASLQTEAEQLQREANDLIAISENGGRPSASKVRLANFRSKANDLQVKWNAHNAKYGAQYVMPTFPFTGSMFR